MAINEIVKRVDQAVPRRQAERLPASTLKGPIAERQDSGMMFKLVRRDRR